MLSPADAPFKKHDDTEAVRSVVNGQDIRYTRWSLWPVNVVYSSFASGSFGLSVEFRPLMKFGLSFTLFWKS